MALKKLTLAIDALGGDNAPDIVLKGANMASQRHPEVHFKIFGPRDLERDIDRLAFLKKSSEILDTTGVIRPDQDVASALRGYKNTTMGRAIEAVKDNEADAVISAGNTGALMVISKMLLKTLKGIHRPAIASFLPTLKGECVMLDLGANVDCDADNLVQFALMGSLFAKDVLGKINPRIGILNIGSEDTKGPDHLRLAAHLMREHKKLNFHGFVEGNDITKGTVDVIVTDGFSGNIALKTAEGVGKLCTFYMRQSFKHSFMAKVGYIFSRGAINRLREQLDPQRYNGAVFLGLNGLSIKSHGSANALGFAAAISTAVDLASQNYLVELASALEETQ